MSEQVPDWYQWHYRPQKIERPDWFTAWPGGARIAVGVRMMHEWQSVPRYASRAASSGGEEQDYRAICQREYGFKEGIWRLLDMFDRHDVKMTALVNGLSAELWPGSVKEIQVRGHEVASHHWDQSIYPAAYKTEAEERAALVRSLDVLEEVTGVRPRGYMSQGPKPSVRTLDVLAAEGMVWTGDYFDCDVPYIIDVKGKKIVSVGFVRPAFTDNDLVPLGLAGGLQQLKDEFDATYGEAERHPMRFGVGIHTFISGGPGMTKMWSDFLAYAKAHDGVWFCTGSEMADFWNNKGQV